MDSHTLIQALIYLGAAALIVPIAVRLGLGSVLGYLIAGCIIGPWGLRLVTDAEAILHFAEIGVVLMLFVIGLELDPQRLWKLRASVFGGGALQMVACGVLIGLFCMLLGLRWQVAELIGMTLALSSTAIAMQAMNERNLTVALSMAATPVLLVLLTRLEKSASGQARDADEIDEEQPRVIVAGFGRFGQIAGRLLLSSGVKMVILDHDPDHVDTLRKFDMKVFYGDATRVDLLESAGAEKAEVLINAIDDPHVSLELVARVKEHFPHLQIISRARDVDHYIQLRQAGVEAPERETFEAALKSGRMTLEALGLGAYEARERADLFRRFNLQMVEEMVAMAENDAASRVAVFKRTSDMLTGIINEDRHHLSLVQRHGWQGTEEGRHTGDIADEPENKPSA